MLTLGLVLEFLGQGRWKTLPPNPTSRKQARTHGTGYIAHPPRRPSVHTSSPFVRSTGNKGGALPPSLCPGLPMSPHRLGSAAASPLCMHFWLLRSCRELQSIRAEMRHAEWGMGRRVFFPERMRMKCPCWQGTAGPDPLSPVLVIKVMMVLLMPSLSRE